MSPLAIDLKTPPIEHFSEDYACPIDEVIQNLATEILTCLNENIDDSITLHTLAKGGVLTKVSQIYTYGYTLTEKVSKELLSKLSKEQLDKIAKRVNELSWNLSCLTRASIRKRIFLPNQCKTYQANVHLIFQAQQYLIPKLQRLIHLVNSSQKKVSFANTISVLSKSGNVSLPTNFTDRETSSRSIYSMRKNSLKKILKDEYKEIIFYEENDPV